MARRRARCARRRPWRGLHPNGRRRVHDVGLSAVAASSSPWTSSTASPPADFGSLMRPRAWAPRSSPSSADAAARVCRRPRRRPRPPRLQARQRQGSRTTAPCASVDFGLARVALATSLAATTSSDDLRPARPRVISSVTLDDDGRVFMGTPLYMAPEQFKAGPPTPAATTRLSFCVALYQALYGGDVCSATRDSTAIMVEVLDGRVRPAPPKTGVPTWLRRISSARPQRAAPDARWASMHDLVAGLARSRAHATPFGSLRARSCSSRSRRLGRRARAGPTRALLCQGGPTRLAGVWETDGIWPIRAATFRANDLLSRAAPGAAAEEWSTSRRSSICYAGSLARSGTATPARPCTCAASNRPRPLIFCMDLCLDGSTHAPPPSPTSPRRRRTGGPSSKRRQLRYRGCRGFERCA